MSCGLRDTNSQNLLSKGHSRIEVTDVWKGGLWKGSELSLSILESQPRSRWFLPLSLSDSGGVLVELEMVLRKKIIGVFEHILK